MDRHTIIARMKKNEYQTICSTFRTRKEDGMYQWMVYSLSLREVDQNDMVLYFICPLSNEVVKRFLSIDHNKQQLLVVPNTFYVNNDDFFKQLKNMSDIYKLTRKNFTLAIINLPSLFSLINDDLLKDSADFTTRIDHYVTMMMKPLSDEKSNNKCTRMRDGRFVFVTDVQDETLIHSILQTMCQDLKDYLRAENIHYPVTYETHAARERSNHYDSVFVQMCYYLFMKKDPSVSMKNSIQSLQEALCEPVIMKNILAKLPYGLFVVDQENKIAIWNKKAEEITGLAQEMVGRSCFEFFNRLLDQDGRKMRPSICGHVGEDCVMLNHKELGFFRHRDGYRIEIMIKGIALENAEGRSFCRSLSLAVKVNGLIMNMRLKGFIMSPT